METATQSGHQCTATRADGQRCRSRACNGRDVPLCSDHTPGRRANPGGPIRHGFLAQGRDPRLEYLRRVRPEDYIRSGGLALAQQSPIGIRQREMDLHPLQPDQVDINVAIADLVHKMEILDALIFRAREYDLDIGYPLSLYLPATTRLGQLIAERHALN
jgi:hypothetical protein